MNEDEIWHRFPYACGLHYYALWWQDYAQQKYRLELLFKVITGKGDPRMMEVLSMDGGNESNLV